MINKQFIMDKDDINNFKTLKNTSIYKDYIKTITNSPIMLHIANEHIKNINIEEDITKIMEKDNMSPKKLNTLFKTTISNTIINVIADTLLIKDIVDISFEDMKTEIEDNFKLNYLLGLADETFYIKAKKLIDNDEIDIESIVYKGYTEYLKRKKMNLDDLNIIMETDISKTIKTTSTINNKILKKKIDLSSDDIDF